MNDLITSKQIDIKSLILIVRGTQVLLDEDVAMLYGYDTRSVNQATNRNKKRFPERFCFQLTREETDSIIGIKGKKQPQAKLKF